MCTFVILGYHVPAQAIVCSYTYLCTFHAPSPPQGCHQVLRKAGPSKCRERPGLLPSALQVFPPSHRVSSRVLPLPGINCPATTVTLQVKQSRQVKNAVLQRPLPPVTNSLERGQQEHPQPGWFPHSPQGLGKGWSLALTIWLNTQLTIQTRRAHPHLLLSCCMDRDHLT